MISRALLSAPTLKVCGLHAHNECVIRFPGSQKSVSHAGKSHVSFNIWDFFSVCFHISSLSPKNGMVAFFRDNTKSSDFALFRNATSNGIHDEAVHGLDVFFYVDNREYPGCPAVSLKAFIQKCIDIMKNLLGIVIF